MTLKNGKWLLLAFAESVFGLTACDGYQCDNKTFIPKCVSDNSRSTCIGVGLDHEQCEGRCSDGICYLKETKACTETTCLGPETEVRCINGVAAQGSQCIDGFACIDKVGCTEIFGCSEQPKNSFQCDDRIAKPDVCSYGEPDICKSGKRMTCPLWYWEVVQCSDSICSDGKCVEREQL